MWKRYVRYLHIAWLYALQYLQKLYIFLRLEKVVFFFKFLFHAYGPEQFEIAHFKSNFNAILAMHEGEWLDSDKTGKINRILTLGHYRWFKIKNFLMFGAFQKRVEKSIYFTFLTHCLEVHNPFTINILERYIEQKANLLSRTTKKIKKVNGREWREYPLILKNIDFFRRNSLVQKKVIQGILEVTLGKSDPPIIRDVKEALKKGLFPLLVIQGLSGTYWMRGSNREIAGLFKPFDEEAFAPNNPGGPGMQGALGKRRMRPGIRVGECAHREVAAFVIDDFFGFGIVPKTYYATFEHHAFFQAGPLADQGGLTRRVKIKRGSFQEYIAGFIILNDLPQEEWAFLPELEIQLLILLDVIVGNCDRNTSNILVGEDKIAAIDHGLCLGDINHNLAMWYWKHLEQAKKPFPSSMVELLKNFPYENLEWKLRKKCKIDLPSFERLRERVMLFGTGIEAGHTPFELVGLLSNENMQQVYGLKTTLKDRCQAILKDHLNKQ